jgi:hypothetical protein
MVPAKTIPCSLTGMKNFSTFDVNASNGCTSPAVEWTIENAASASLYQPIHEVLGLHCHTGDRKKNCFFPHHSETHLGRIEYTNTELNKPNHNKSSHLEEETNARHGMRKMGINFVSKLWTVSERITITMSLL